MCCLFGIMDNNGSLTGKQKTRLIRALAAECVRRAKTTP